MTPLERAAKAAYEHGNTAAGFARFTAWEELPPKDRLRTVDSMRAGVATLMEPGDEIEDIGTVEFHRVYTLYPIARSVWQAMLKKVIEP